MLDLIAAIRALVKHADTYMDLVWKLVGTFPKGYQRVDIVANTYRELSIKDGEGESRGSSMKVIISSEKSKIP